MRLKRLYFFGLALLLLLCPADLLAEITGRTGYAEPDTNLIRFRVGLFNEKYLCTPLDTGWKRGFELKVDDFRKGLDIWLRLKLPDTLWNNPAFSFYGYFSNLKVYLDTTLILGDESIRGNGRYLTTYVLPMRQNYSGRYVYLRTKIENLFYLGEIHRIYIGSMEKLYELKEKSEASDNTELIINAMIGSALCLLCLYSFFIFFTKFSLRLYPFLLFGIVCLCVGIEYIIQPLAAISIINVHYGNYALISALALFLLSPVFIAFLEMIFGRGWKSLIRRLWQISAIIAVIFIAAISIDLRNIVYFPDLNTLYIIEILILVVICLISGIFKRREVRPVLIGLGVFLLAAMLELLEEPLKLKIMPALTGWGVLVLAFSLGHTLLKYYIVMIEKFQLSRQEVIQKNAELNRLKEENLRSQYEALKNQVNPHFLFNTFSSLISTIEENPEEAVKFVHKLSNVYRYVLLCQEKQLIGLAAELDFAKSYTFLLTRRYEDNFTVNIETPADMKGMFVIPLALQMLIENIIKHNVISSKKPMRVDITYDETGRMLTVRNILQRKNISYPATKLGLKNIINRYSFFTDKKVVIIEEENCFSVSLPIIEKESDDERGDN